MLRRFRQVDVFCAEPLLGNPVAVVLDAEDLDTEQLQQFARWTNLSETTFVLPPTPEGRAAGADYRLRIFMTSGELPFAGHPTLGSCHAWLEAGGSPQRPGTVVQECGAGLVRLRNGPDGLAFAAPPLVRSGPADESVVTHLAELLRIERGSIVDAQWVDNGPGWVAVLLPSAEAVLALRPGPVDLFVGAVGPYPAGSPEAFEVRAFCPVDGGAGLMEDPVTGSLNASLALWLLGTDRARAPYLVSQGTALGRRGRVRVDRDADGTVWVGGRTVTCVTGTVDLAGGSPGNS